MKHPPESVQFFSQSSKEPVSYSGSTNHSEHEPCVERHGDKHKTIREEELRPIKSNLQDVAIKKTLFSTHLISIIPRTGYIEYYTKLYFLSHIYGTRFLPNIRSPSSTIERNRRSCYILLGNRWPTIGGWGEILPLVAISLMNVWTF